MKRSLLILVPALAMFLMACPQRHATVNPISPPPGSPDPNGYNQGTQSNSSSGTYTQPGYDGGGVTINTNSSSSSSNSSAVTHADSVHAQADVTHPHDTVIHVAGKPDTVIVGSRPDSIRTRFVVSFISKGGGIDLAAQKNFEKWLSKHPNDKYFVTHWGREGEVDYCFQLIDKRGEDQVKFVKEVKELIGVNERVLYKENTVCRHQHLNAVAGGASEVVEAMVVEVKDDSSNISRVVVQFISKGAGIDSKAKDKLEAWLKEQNIAYDEKNWGREGEVSVCIPLKEKKDSRQQEIFVRDLRTFIGENDRVIVEEWGKCDKRK